MQILALPLGLASMQSSCLGCIAAAHILVSEFLTAISWTDLQWRQDDS